MNAHALVTCPLAYKYIINKFGKKWYLNPNFFPQFWPVSDQILVRILSEIGLILIEPDLEKFEKKLDFILPQGESLKSLVCASHAQGAIFSDAKDFITQNLIQLSLNFIKSNLKSQKIKLFFFYDFKQFISDSLSAIL